MPRFHEGTLDAKGLRVGLVVSRYNELISERLLQGALDCLRRHGASDDALRVVRVPGGFEMPLAAKKLAGSGKVDAVVCLGAVIRGDTQHFEIVANEAARGVARAALETGVPVTFGVLAAETLEQAIQRAGAKAGNKGWDAAQAAIEMVHVLRELEREK
jgi:6,7-dimethyl-8-ribityllumazine synthase